MANVENIRKFCKEFEGYCDIILVSNINWVKLNQIKKQSLKNKWQEERF